MERALSVGLDIIIIAIFVGCIVIAVRNGLVKSIISLLGNIIALVVAFTFSVSLGAYINANYVREPMQQWLINSLSATAEGTNASAENLDFDKLFADKPEFFTKTLKFLGVDSEKISAEYEVLKFNGQEQAKAAIIDIMINPLAGVISRTIAFLIIYILCIIAVRILWWLSDFIVNIPIIRQLNKVGGAVLGIINGILIIFVTVSLLNVLLVYMLKDKTVAQREEIVNNTMIYKRIDSWDPLSKVFEIWE